MPRYRYDKKLDKMVEITSETKPQSGAFYLPDIDAAYGGDGFRSPIDGTQITSRAQLRRHEITHGVRQCGDYKRGEVINAQKTRVQRDRDFLTREARGTSFKWQ